MKLIFASSDSISFPVIEALHEKILCFVAPPARPKGRGQKLEDPETVKFLKEKFPQIPILQTENINENIEELKKYSPDAILVFSFAQFFKKKFLESFPVFNIHTSLLPKYRGASPIQAALLNRDQETGVSLQKMKLKLDTGPIVGEKKVLIDENDNYQSLSQKLSLASAELALNFVKNFSQLKYIEQDESKASYAGLIKKEDGKISRDDTLKITLGKILGLSEWPGSYVEIDGKKIKIISVKKTDVNGPKNRLYVQNKKLFLGCRDGSLEILELQPESKPKMDALSFMNGYKQFIDKEITAKEIT